MEKSSRDEDRAAIDELNGILKNEYMTVGYYDRYIGQAGQGSVSNMLQEIRLDHKRHAAGLSRRILELGGEPVKGTGLTGLAASVRGSASEIKGRDGLELLSSAYDGEDKGIAKTEMIAGDGWNEENSRNPGNGLDRESLKLVEEILAQDHEHLKALARMMGKMEESK